MKDVVWFHLKIEEGMPGRFTFHNETELEFYRHMLSEERKLQSDGKWKWIRRSEANHLFDCVTIAFSMADSEFRGGIRLVRPPMQGPPPDKKQTNLVTQRPRG
jgi:hypothetical protein